MKTLKEVKIGETCKVVRLHGEGAVKRRIMDMGITKGVEVYIRKVAPLGDPLGCACAAIRFPCGARTPCAWKWRQHDPGAPGQPQQRKNHAV